MTVVYEDGLVTCTLPKDGAVPGHVTITLKQDEKYLSDLSNEAVEHVFIVASMVSTAVFEGLGAQGTNILIHEGEALVAHVLPRNPDDGIDLFWKAERASPDELSSSAGRVKDALWYVGKQAEKAPPAPQTPDPAVPPKERVSDGPNYKLEHLKRSP